MATHGSRRFWFAVFGLAYRAYFARGRDERGGRTRKIVGDVACSNPSSAGSACPAGQLDAAREEFLARLRGLCN
jgi:hypothetical protein